MRLIRGLILIGVLAAAGLFGAPPLSAQTLAQSETPALESLQQSVNQIEGTVRHGALSIGALADLSRRLSPIRDDLRNHIATLEPRLAEVEERLKQLGPAPAFANFGDSALAFELGFVCTDVYQSGAVMSEVRSAILKALAQADIKIPYP